MKSKTTRDWLGRASVVIVVFGLLVGCSSVEPTMTVLPTVGLPVTVSVDCGPFAGDLSDCLSIVSAAAKVLPGGPGSRAQVTKGVAAASCRPERSCIVPAGAALIASVTFTAPGGREYSAEVITNPQGQYVGANPFGQ